MVGTTMTLESRNVESKIFSDPGTSPEATRSVSPNYAALSSGGSGVGGTPGTEGDSMDDSVGSNSATTPSTYVTYATVNGGSGSGVSVPGVVDISSATTLAQAQLTTTTITATNADPPATGQTISYAYAISDSGLYGSGTGSHLYASGSGASGIAYTQENGVTYLVQTPSSTNNESGNNSSTLNLDNDMHLASPVTRVSPVTVQWLLDNFETAEGVSLPRYTLYHHYIRHCVEHKLDPVNAASFGKLIRSVFLGLRTRRLGTRGNSKYHYYGIRLKPDSPLNDVDVSQIEEQLFGNGSGQTNGGSSGGRYISNHGHGASSNMICGPSNKRYKSSRASFDSGDLSTIVSTVDSVTIQHFLGDSSHVLKSLPQLKTDFPIPESLSSDDIKTFGVLYLDHCGHLLADLMHFQLVDFQRRWRTFWRSVGENGNSLHLIEQGEYEAQLSKEKLLQICTLKEIQEYVQHTDFEFYQCLANVLLPEVLRPIPGPMTTTIRNFAKAVENCLGSAMTGYCEDIINVKLNVLGSFSQTLRRYTSLNHLAQAARAVLQNESQINQMITDLNRVDFHPLEDQARWISGCSGDLFSELEEEFKSTLAQHQGLEEWSHWLENAVDKVLRPYANTDRYSIVARQFLMSWSLYSSLVIRDLTLRSAASFGSFHLLRLLYDEYLFYIVEHRVAKFEGVTPISLLGRKTLNPAFYEPHEPENEEEDENSAADSS